MRADTIQNTLNALADEDAAAHAARFFKTGQGQYGEGDRFLGIRVPVLRSMAKAHDDLALSEIAVLLRSAFHETRLLALLIMVRQFQRGDQERRRRIYQCYLGGTRWVNNWDLVDSSAYHILGSYLAHRERTPLYRLAASDRLWERRMAIVATLHFIRQGQFEDTLRIAERLRDDDHDLIHKAVGWMLREVGKRDREALETFLRAHYRRMPRTMLRYAIEKFPDPRRKQYLHGQV